MGDIIRKETPFGEVLEIFKKRDFVMSFMGGVCYQWFVARL